jgi:hypothetical protein
MTSENKVCHEKIIKEAQLIMKFTTIYRIRKLIFMFTRSCYWPPILFLYDPLYYPSTCT